MWPFKPNKRFRIIEPSPYLYTFERVGRQSGHPFKGSRTVAASGDVTIDELLTRLCSCTPSGTGWGDECQTLVLRIRAVERPKQWEGEV